MLWLIERRDARVAEEARLESVYTCQRVSRVRIPVSPPSPAEAIFGVGGQFIGCSFANR